MKTVWSAHSHSSSLLPYLTSLWSDFSASFALWLRVERAGVQLGLPPQTLNQRFNLLHTLRV